MPGLVTSWHRCIRYNMERLQNVGITYKIGERVLGVLSAADWWKGHEFKDMKVRPEDCVVGKWTDYGDNYEEEGKETIAVFRKMDDAVDFFKLKTASFR